jgi:phage-related protein
VADFPANPKPEYPILEMFEEPEVLISRHRDGSEQRRYKGQGKLRGYRLSWASMLLSTSEKDAIRTHYAGQSGKAIAFHWTHPETATVHLVRYDAVPSFTAVGPDAWTGEIAFQVVPA